jgi:glycosyltransferase involved in cell wall biosynthesis
MIDVGIDCQTLEGEAWGVGRLVEKLLTEIDRRPELRDEFRFFLYFKTDIPDYPYLKNPIFIKRLLRVPFISSRSFAISFSFYYFLFLPVRSWFETHDVMYFPNYMLPLTFRGKSMVMLTPDMFYEMRHGKLNFGHRLSLSIFGNWAARHATKIVTLTEAAGRELTDGFHISEKRIAIVPNGVDFNTSAAACAKPNGPYLLYVGQAFPRRHLKETILAFENIVPEFPGLKLIAVGKDKNKPPVIDDLIQTVNGRLGREAVVRHTYVSHDELWNLYSHAEALTYVSSKEAFGFPPIEALSRGTVPVVADDPVTREILGDDAFFVKNPDSVDDIAHAMKDALLNHNKREEIRRAAGAIVRRYSWQNHTDRFLEAVRSIARSS